MIGAIGKKKIFSKDFKRTARCKNDNSGVIFMYFCMLIVDKMRLDDYPLSGEQVVYMLTLNFIITKLNSFTSNSLLLYM